MEKEKLRKDLDNLLFFYELYLKSLDEENYLEWCLLFDIRTKIEKKLQKCEKISRRYSKKVYHLDRELKEKVKNCNEKIRFSRLRKMMFPKPPEDYWWYYLDRNCERSKLRVEVSHRERELNYNYV